MQYHSERELQDDFGWGFITEAQYDRYRSFSAGGRLPWSSCRRQRANWLCAWCAASWRILTQIAGSGSFSALSPEDQQAERARAEQSQKEWKRKIAELKRKRGIIEASEDMEEG